MFRLLGRKHLYSINLIFLIYVWTKLNPRKAGGGDGVNLTRLWFFQKCIFWKEGETLFFYWFFFYFQYYHKLDLSWKFYWNSSSHSEDVKTFSVNTSYFHRFSSIFWIFWHFLVTKKLMTSAYNRWCQHFFTFNIL